MKETNVKKLNNYIYASIAILASLALGKLVAFTLGGLPGSLYGMIFFALSLHFGVVKASKVEFAIALIISQMGVCFVPAGVGIINYLDFLKQYALTIVAMVVVTTVIILVLVGFIAQKMLKTEDLPHEP